MIPGANSVVWRFDKINVFCTSKTSVQTSSSECLETNNRITSNYKGTTPGFPNGDESHGIPIRASTTNKTNLRVNYGPGALRCSVLDVDHFIFASFQDCQGVLMMAWFEKTGDQTKQLTMDIQTTPVVNHEIKRPTNHLTATLPKTNSSEKPVRRPFAPKRKLI